MKLYPVLCLTLCILLLGQAGADVIRRSRQTSPDLSDPDPLINEVDTDDSSEEDDAKKPLGIVAIKIRHIQADAELCQQLSRYHPHHPQCHGYCKRQGHWIGQCKKEKCHCFS
ncbi:hypothetical protein KR009_007474 [Drosophila setifemur]|nr:hypothetical protein KR009_007474 [Drosophila setifemur]